MREDIMSRYTTLGVGGKAVVIEAYSPEQLVALGKSAVILGGGSNVLIAEKSLPLFALNKTRGISVDGSRVYVQSGERMSRLCQVARERCLSGLEWAAGLPGSVGGAIGGNAGAMGQSMSALIEYVDAYVGGEVKRLWRDECGFSYRRSRFGRGDVIMGAALRLRRGSEKQLRENIEKTAEMRRNQPKGRSAGCIFKNPKGVSIGKVMEEIGLKGKSVGGAVISPKHANFIINDNGARASDVYELIIYAERRLTEALGYTPEREIKIYGEF